MKFHIQSTWHELDVWVNVMGIESMEAIRSGTYWPAVLMGVDDDYGTVSEGKYADIIAVEGDVLRHISLLRDVDELAAPSPAQAASRTEPPRLPGTSNCW